MMSEADVNRLMGRLIAERRERADLTQEKLGACLSSHLGKSTVSAIERGQHSIRVPVFIEFAAALGCKGQDLLAELEARIEAAQQEAVA
jgi:transcriptional regulator with XRE-family HTH domain